MCGVFVVCSKDNSKLSTSLCLNASKELFNRGPDVYKDGFFFNRSLYVANTILSITGKKSNNNKLISSFSGRYKITFNGEIYNYKELQQVYLRNKNLSKQITDTQVLINLYESVNSEKIPRIINGMFAYVVYDTQKKKLIINTDTQGEKKLYYFNSSNYFIISSTIQSILKFVSKYKINIEELKNYIGTRHFMPIDNSAIKNIKTFRPGSINEFCLSSKNLKQNLYEDPLDWVSEKTYERFNKYSEDEMVEYFDYELNKQAKLLVPQTKFGCIVSGGIDSTLQSIIISKYKKPSHYFTIDHGNKDYIMKHIHKFNSFFSKKIDKVKLSEIEYKILAKKCYSIISSPLFTHDLPARLKISKYFKKNNCKVFFSADGCDELFGGQQIYYDIFRKNYNLNYNKSPYSSFNNTIKSSDRYTKKLKLMWTAVLKKYNFIESKKEKNIQSSFFLDYFIQSINVANRSNDLISCNNSVEPRNIYISKNILKIIVNLPLKYKLDLNEKKIEFRQKKLLKKIFCKYFDKRLIFKKTGFSGFPNSLRSYNNNYPLTKKILSLDLKKISKHKKYYYDKKNFFRDMEWKIINLENFLNVFR